MGRRKRQQKSEASSSSMSCNNRKRRRRSSFIISDDVVSMPSRKDDDDDDTDNCNESKKQSKKQKINKKSLNRSKLYLMKNAIRQPLKLPIYQIPKHKLENALKILNDNNFIKPSASLSNTLTPSTSKSKQCLPCLASVHEINSRKHDTINVIAKLLKEARKCLLRRDWINLSKILCYSKFYYDRNGYEIYYNIFRKYAEICLVHNPDKILIDNFKNGVLTIKDQDYDDKLFRKLTKKYGDHFNDDEDSSDGYDTVGDYCDGDDDEDDYDYDDGDDCDDNEDCDDDDDDNKDISLKDEVNQESNDDDDDDDD